VLASVLHRALLGLAASALVCGSGLGCAPGAGSDPCLGVTCAPGRVCQAGVCQEIVREDRGVTFPDRGWLLPDGSGGDAPLQDASVADQQVDSAGGQWIQADTLFCPVACSLINASNVASSDGAYCISGEARPASAIAAGIKFTFGCTANCVPGAPPGAQSVGAYCYLPGQKRDGDKTDLTVGCFCR
jgi:hypothetical protein